MGVRSPTRIMHMHYHHQDKLKIGQCEGRKQRWGMVILANKEEQGHRGKIMK
jgi:hypothetical protein